MVSPSRITPASPQPPQSNDKEDRELCYRPNKTNDPRYSKGDCCSCEEQDCVNEEQAHSAAYITNQVAPQLCSPGLVDKVDFGYFKLWWGCGVIKADPKFIKESGTPKNCGDTQLF